jgi:acyl-CoA reductase-like NAD-dependent aldehyde dehydrogenase
VKRALVAVALAACSGHRDDPRAAPYRAARDLIASRAPADRVAALRRRADELEARRDDLQHRLMREQLEANVAPGPR